MNHSNQELDEFLTKMGISPEFTDISKTAEIFRQEMQDGLSGKASSLAMIPSFITNTFSAIENECVIAIDAGGTNLRISLVRLHLEKLPEILSMKRFPMPGTK